MNQRAFTISLVLAGLAVFMIYSYISSKEQEYKTKYGTDAVVVVAKHDIDELTEIHETMIEITHKPKQFIEPGRTTSKQEVEGFIAKVPIRKGEQITLNKIIAPGVETGLSRQVSIGKRGIAIPVTEETAVGKLIKPGDRVDLLADIEVGSGQQKTIKSKMIQQDLPVLSVGQWVTTQAPRKVEKDEVSGKEVTRNLNIDRTYSQIVVEVDPVTAAQIVLLRGTGVTIFVVMRNNDDTERVSVPVVTAEEILGGGSVRVPAAQK